MVTESKRHKVRCLSFDIPMALVLTTLDQQKTAAAVVPAAKKKQARFEDSTTALGRGLGPSPSRPIPCIPLQRLVLSVRLAPP
jgi:hypothetical protein